MQKKKERDLLKKTNKLPQKQPTKKKSPNTYQINSGLRVVKTDSDTEGRARQALARSGQTSI